MTSNQTAALPPSIQQALKSYKPSFLSNLRSRVHLLIRGVYDHLRDADSSETKRFSEEVIKPLAEMCVVAIRMEEANLGRSEGYASAVVRAFSDGDYLHAIEEYCPEAVLDYEYRGRYYYDKQDQQSRVVGAIAQGSPEMLAQVMSVKRFRDLPYPVREHLVDWGVDPNALFAEESSLTNRCDGHEQS